MFKRSIWLIASMLIWLPLLGAACHVSSAHVEALQLKLRTLNGDTFFLSDQRGKVVVLAFGSVRTPLAGQTIPALARLASHYAGHEVAVYWVSIDSAKAGVKGSLTDAELQAVTARYAPKLTILRDPEKIAFNSLQFDAVPTVIVVSRQGELVREYVGFDAESKRGYSELLTIIDRQIR